MLQGLKAVGAQPQVNLMRLICYGQNDEQRILHAYVSHIEFAAEAFCAPRTGPEA
jgi:urease accessory protein UreF